MDLATIIREAATRHGLSPDVLLRIAQIESRMNPGAANPNSSARGLFQFLTKGPGSSWAEYGRGADVFDPYANADAGARYTRDNVAHLRNALGRDPTPGETYLAHQQGRGGAVALLRNPEALAVDALAPVQRDPHAAIALNGGRPDMTAGQFAALWDNKFNGIRGQSPVGGEVTQTVGPGGNAPTNPAFYEQGGAAQDPFGGLGGLFATALAQLATPEPKKSEKKPDVSRILANSSPNLVLSA